MKWILCDERLPKEGQMVLTTIRGHDVIIPQEGETIDEAIDRIWNDVCYVSIGFVGSDGWYGADGFPEVVHPIAWMPLPKPYKADRKTENSSEKPNNCEHITEDGVTCAKYPACDDCLDNPLNKVKGSERLVKGSEQTDCLDRYDRKTEATISKMEQVDKDINVRSKDEPQTDCAWR